VDSSLQKFVVEISGVFLNVTAQLSVTFVEKMFLFICPFSVPIQVFYDDFQSLFRFGMDVLSSEFNMGTFKRNVGDSTPDTVSSFQDDMLNFIFGQSIGGFKTRDSSSNNDYLMHLR
jgi:hypothetical protein